MARSQINAADPQTINPIKASRHQWPCVHGSGHSAPSICNPLHPAGNTSSQDEDNASIVSHWSRHKSCSESHLRPSSTGLSHHKTEPSSPHAPASKAMANIIHQSHTTQPGLSLSLISCLARVVREQPPRQGPQSRNRSKGAGAKRSNRMRSDQNRARRAPHDKKGERVLKRNKRQRQRSNIEKRSNLARIPCGLSRTRLIQKQPKIRAFSTRRISDREAQT